MSDLVEFLKGLYGMVDLTSVIAVFVLVWVWGKAGVTGKWQLLSSFLTGLAIGILQRWSTGTITGFEGWFQVAMYGIILGGLASGAYETIKGAITKVLEVKGLVK